MRESLKAELVRTIAELLEVVHHQSILVACYRIGRKPDAETLDGAAKASQVRERAESLTERVKGGEV